MAWGINNGYLSRKEYLPAVIQANPQLRGPRPWGCEDTGRVGENNGQLDLIPRLGEGYRIGGNQRLHFLCDPNPFEIKHIDAGCHGRDDL